MNERPAPRRRRRPSFSDLTSVIALAGSLFALAIGAWQTRLMQTQARAGVWPYLAEGFTYSSHTDENGYVLTIDNNGVGPARVESVVVRLDGKPVTRWKALMDALGIDGDINYSTSTLNGEVIPPNLNRETTIPALRINERHAAGVFRNATARIAIDICYCSVYDDCWTSHWQQTEVEPVGKCRADGVQFED